MMKQLAILVQLLKKRIYPLKLKNVRVWLSFFVYSRAKEEKSKKKENVNDISDPILLEQYTAIADYKKQKNTECSLAAGQVVEVIDKNENGTVSSFTLSFTFICLSSSFLFLFVYFHSSFAGWWFVHMDDLNEGWVPATYLEPIYGQTEANKV